MLASWPIFQTRNHRQKWFLMGDSGAGIVYRHEVLLGKGLEDQLMKPESRSFGVGVNFGATALG